MGIITGVRSFRYRVVSILACEQALRGALAAGREKEGKLVTTSLEFEYLHQKVDAKCWLAEMTLVMSSLPLTRVFQCLLTFALIGGNLTTLSTGSNREIGSGISIIEVVASSPSFSRPKSLPAGYFDSSVWRAKRLSTWEAIYEWNCDKYLIRHIDPTKSKWWYTMRHSNSYKVVNNSGYIQQDNQDAKKNSLTCCSSLWNRKLSPNLLSGTST